MKAIIFDFGNVIATFDNNKFLERISKYTKKTVDELDKIIYHESGLPKKYERGQISSDVFFRDVSDLCELDISEKDFISAYTDIFTPIKSTFELIKSLNNNYRLALLSNTSAWDFEYGIKKISVFDMFETVSLSFEVGEMKPGRKIFDDCLSKLSLKADECIYIDDIKAYSDKATELGMVGIHYVSSEDLVDKLSEYGVKV